VSRFDASLFQRALQALGKPPPPPAPLPEADRPTAVEIAAELCRRFEGFYSRPYICPAGVPTIGYGATHYLNGVRVTLKDAPISKEAAERLLIAQIERVYLPEVLRLCPGLMGESAGKLAAIIDFTFNLGGGRLKASTLRKRINAGEWELVPAELRKWTIGGGQVLRGLVIRRDAEIACL
jgi:lysozyme